MIKLLKNSFSMTKKHNKIDGNWITLYLCFYMRNNYIIKSLGLHSHTEQKYQVRALPFLVILTRDVLLPLIYILNLNRSSTNHKQSQTCIYCTIPHLQKPFCHQPAVPSAGFVGFSAQTLGWTHRTWCIASQMLKSFLVVSLASKSMVLKLNF